MTRAIQPFEEINALLDSAHEDLLSMVPVRVVSAEGRIRNAFTKVAALPASDMVAVCQSIRRLRAAAEQALVLLGNWRELSLPINAGYSRSGLPDGGVR